MSQAVFSPGNAIIPASRLKTLSANALYLPSSNVQLLRPTNHHRQRRLRSLTTPVRCSTNFSFDLKGGKGFPIGILNPRFWLMLHRMNKFHEYEVRVRDYELDQYGVVNNAVFANYCQDARRELLQKIGINIDTVAKSGNAIAISDLSLKFLGPLRIGDRFTVRVRISDSSAARIYFEHFIFKIPNEEVTDFTLICFGLLGDDKRQECPLMPILEARATAVWLDKNYRPVRVPPEFLTLENRIVKLIHLD
ncbi:hypothetical protein LXL04_011274 [Taraxacum kok-saghyz]